MDHQLFQNRWKCKEDGEIGSCNLYLLFIIVYNSDRVYLASCGFINAANWHENTNCLLLVNL